MIGITGIMIVIGLVGCGGESKDIIGGSNTNESTDTNEVKTQVTIVAESPEQKKLYQFISDENWDDAEILIYNTDVSMIDDMDFIRKYIKIRQDVIKLKQGQTHVNYETISKNLDTLNREEYNGVFNKQFLGFKDTFKVELSEYYKKVAAQEKIKKELIWGEIDNALNNGEFSIVASLASPYMNSDIDFGAIYNFAHYHMSGQGGDDEGMMNYLLDIPLDFNGRYAELIMDFKLSHQSKDKWIEDYAYRQTILAKIEQDKIDAEVRRNIEASKPNPFIGMTQDELINSKWGTPKDINRTTTQYGTSEQWVYGNGNYVYLDDGIVTTIQN
jgi:hypothetical protein